MRAVILHLVHIFTLPELAHLLRKAYLPKQLQEKNDKNAHNSMDIVPIVFKINMRVCFDCGYHTKSTLKGLVQGACRNRRKTEKYICRGLGLT